MAPTGVLARQYADKTGPLLSQAGMSWALLTGATPAAERERIHAQLESGELDVLFSEPTRSFRITWRLSICRS